jgi:hypothetical protein
MMYKRCRLNPTNGVGGLFILSLHSSVTGLKDQFISRARLAAARRAREMN